MDCLVSVIIPIYNASKYLNDCLQSLLSQSYKQLEVIMVNDGSTDNSEQICKEYCKADNRFIIYNKQNGGVSAARNYGIEKANGEWILFVDSDDYVNSCFIETYIKAIDKLGQDSFIFQGFIKESNGASQTNILPEKYFNKNEKDAAINYLHIDNNAFGFCWAKIYNTNIIKHNKLHFDTNLSMSEDLIFTLDYLSVCNSISVMECANYHYRCDIPNSLSKSKWNYKMLKLAIDAAAQREYAICGKNSPFLNKISLVNLNSSFWALLSLFENKKEQYSRQFIEDKIHEYKSQKLAKQLRHKSIIYNALHKIIIYTGTKFSYTFLRIFYLLKTKRENTNINKSK